VFRELLSQTDLTAGPIIALVVFFAAFVGVLVWVSRRSHGAHFERMNRLPLGEGEENSDEQGHRRGP